MHPSGCLRINPSLKRQLFDELPKINRMPTLYALCNDIIQVKVNEKLYIEKELNVQEKLIIHIYSQRFAHFVQELNTT